MSAQSKIGDDEDMHEEAKHAVIIEPWDEDPYAEDVRDELFVGNHGGLYLARRSARVPVVEDELALAKREQNSLKKQQNSLKTEHNPLDDKVPKLSNRIPASTALQYEYLQVRGSVHQCLQAW